MKGFLKFVGILTLICLILDALTDDKKKAVKAPTGSSSQNSVRLVTQPKPTVKTPNTQSEQELVKKEIVSVENPIQEQEMKRELAEKETVSFENSTQGQKTTKDTTNDKEDNRVFRRKQCEDAYSKIYCDCLISHVTKHLGFFDEVIWLQGGALTDVGGIKAMREAEKVCFELELQDQIKKDKEEREKREKELEQSRKLEEERERKVLNYDNKFCNLGAFYKLIKPSKDTTLESLAYYVRDIELIEGSESELCKVLYRCTRCYVGTETELFFEKKQNGEYEFNVKQGIDASSILYSLGGDIHNLATIKELIDKGADVTYQPQKNKSNFCLSIMDSGNLDLVKMCLNYISDINTQYSTEYNGETFIQTPLYTAVEHNNVDVARFLLEKGANPNIPRILKRADEIYKTYPIERTIFFADTTMAKLLLKHGARMPDIVKYTVGDKPLIWGILQDRAGNVAERLDLWLSLGADMNAYYKFQKPIEYAEKNKMFDVVQVLQKYGAKPQHEITDLRWCNTEYSKQICGTFINNTESTLKTVYITFSVYDSENAIIGDAMAYNTNLGPKEKWKFEAISTVDSGVRSYKLKEITIFDF